ncbi:MAG TPA: hypothetical protein VE871_05710 [Longimicrobium sp.]|nr:hypothetical protein [Longimicrobium sp.]
MTLFRRAVAAASMAVALLSISTAPGTAQTVGGGRECDPIWERTIIYWGDGEVWIIDRQIGESCVTIID